MDELDWVWIFVGGGAQFPSGAFRSVESAEMAIAKHRLTGVLTKYPLDTLIYDLAAANQHFTVKNDSQRTPEFIGRFSSASQEHRHYENGAPA
jgi:hypothetical protein